MAKVAIRELPSTLPASRIYLDQLEEIQKVFIEAFPPDTPISFEYDDDDTNRFSSLHDLQEHGGKSSNFKLRLVRGTGSTVLAVGSSIMLFMPYDMPADGWTVYGKIEQILSPKNDPLIKVLDPIPFGYFIVGWLACTPLGAISVHFGLTRTTTVFLALEVIFAIASVVKAYTAWRKSVIYFHYERLSQKETAKRRNEFAKDLILVALGVTLKWAFDFFASGHK